MDPEQFKTFGRLLISRGVAFASQAGAKAVAAGIGSVAKDVRRVVAKTQASVEDLERRAAAFVADIETDENAEAPRASGGDDDGARPPDGRDEDISGKRPSRGRRK